MLWNKKFDMKNMIICLVVSFAFIVTSQAQTATETKLEYQRGEKIAATIDLPYHVDIVEGALINRLKSATVKDERLKGMLVFKGARVTPTDGEAVDFYFKVDRKGKKDDSTSTVFLILGRPNENVALRTLNDNFRIDDAKRFLTDVVPEVASFKLDTDIADHDEKVKKTEKSITGLTDDQKKLEERIKELQDRLSQNKLDQEKQNAELNRLRSSRDALLSKRGAAK